MTGRAMELVASRAIWVVALAFLVSGCAVGNVHRYSDTQFDSGRGDGKEVAVGVHDQRPYVLNMDKAPNFVGLSRGGFGNPFNVTTASGNPLAWEMTEAITASLSQSGFKAKPTGINYSDTAESIAKKLAKTGAARQLLLTVKEWKTDTYMSTALHYSVDLTVFDGSGAKLAAISADGKDDLGSDAWNPPKHAKQAVPVAFKRRMEELFLYEDVRKALE